MTSPRTSFDIDSTESTLHQKRCFQEKPILRSVYMDFYKYFVKSLQGIPEGPIVEIGSGGGFIKEHLPNIITTECLYFEHVDMVCSGLHLPFCSQSVSGIVLLNVFHHIPDVEVFLREASRVLKPGGVLTMIEPANTLFSSMIYKYFHHEDFNPNAASWKLPPGGRLSTANGALPWIVFVRDRDRFKRDYPEFEIHEVAPFLPFQYILSGGFSRPQLLPSRISQLIVYLERMFSPFDDYFGLFTKITIRTRSSRWCESGKSLHE